MNHHRRKALKLGAGITTGFVASLVLPTRRLSAADDKNIRVGVMGLSRGMAHINAFTKIPGVEVAYVCDVDKRRLAAGAKRAAESQPNEPRAVEDFRRMLDDASVDAISIAAPNFWHAPATILACAAGKHVYVEKPGSQNPHESELMVAAARKNNRRVQMGVQRRSAPHYVQAIERLRSGGGGSTAAAQGAIGTLRYARCWYDNARGSLGTGEQAPIPEWLNYELWQGPTPETPYKDNLVHYNWHWHWNWGNGELGNNGVHALDVARWGMQVNRPRSASYSGGRYHFDDDQETPDTGCATFDFGHCGISWDHSSCLPRGPEKHAFVSFYGDGGMLAIDDQGFTIYDEKGTEVEHVRGNVEEQLHFQNFIDAIRDDVELTAEIGNCQPAAMLCHYGNIAYRVNRVVNVDESNGKIVEDSEAMKLWHRTYRAGWEPKL